MIHYGFPENTEISTVTPPKNISNIWLATIPEDEVTVDTQIRVDSDIAANNLLHLCTCALHSVYGFTNNPVIKYFDSKLKSWTDVEESMDSRWIEPYVDHKECLVIRQAREVIQSDTTLNIR